WLAWAETGRTATRLVERKETNNKMTTGSFTWRGMIASMPSRAGPFTMWPPDFDSTRWVRAKFASACASFVADRRAPVGTGLDQESILLTLSGKFQRLDSFSMAILPMCPRIDSGGRIVN